MCSSDLHARWEREDEIARNNKMTKVCTITTSSNTEVPSASIPPTSNGKIVGDSTRAQKAKWLRHWMQDFIPYLFHAGTFGWFGTLSIHIF